MIWGKKPKDLGKEYEDWKGETKSEKREKKKTKEMPVHGSELFEVWKMKLEKPKKQTKIKKPKIKK